MMLPKPFEDLSMELLLTKNKFIYKNKDSFILNITDLSSLKQLGEL